MVHTTCAVSDCKSSSHINKNLRFHQLPRTEERCKLWVEACSRPDLLERSFGSLKNIYICSLHFEDGMYGKKSLKKTAIPTLLLPIKDSIHTQTDHKVNILCDVKLDVHNQSRFPKDEILRNKWLTVIRRAVNPEKKRICHKHFNEKDVYYDTACRRHLKLHAVPTLFLGDGDVGLVRSPRDSEHACPAPTNNRIEEMESGHLKIKEEELETSSEQICAQLPFVQDLPIVARVYLYLEKEYEYMKSLNGYDCDLSPLADILKRTAEATGTSEENVITVLETEELMEHLPERAKRKRKKTQHVYLSALDMSSSNVNYITPDPQQTQIKLKANDDVCSTSRSAMYIEISPLTTNLASNDNNETSNTAHIQVKVEPVEDEVATTINNTVLEQSPPESNQSYCNRAEDITMEIEQYTFVPSNPSEPPTTSEPADVTIKLEPQDEKDY